MNYNYLGKYRDHQSVNHNPSSIHLLPSLQALQMRPIIKSLVSILAAAAVTFLLLYTAPFIFSFLKFTTYYLFFVAFSIPTLIYTLSYYAVDLIGNAAVLIFKGLGYIIECITEVGPSILKALWEVLTALVRNVGTAAWSGLKAVARLGDDEDHELR